MRLSLCLKMVLLWLSSTLRDDRTHKQAPTEQQELEDAELTVPVSFAFGFVNGLPDLPDAALLQLSVYGCGTAALPYQASSEREDELRSC